MNKERKSARRKRLALWGPLFNPSEGYRFGSVAEVFWVLIGLNIMASFIQGAVLAVGLLVFPPFLIVSSGLLLGHTLVLVKVYVGFSSREWGSRILAAERERNQIAAYARGDFQ